MRKTLWILTIVFVVLKLVGVIMWSWWLVLLPMIISLIITFIIWSCLILFGAITDK